VFVDGNAGHGLATEIPDGIRNLMRRRRGRSKNEL
jgi:hypothetical protein